MKSGKLCFVFVFVFSVLKCLCCVMSCDFLSLPWSSIISGTIFINLSLSLFSFYFPLNTNQRRPKTKPNQTQQNLICSDRFLTWKTSNFTFNKTKQKSFFFVCLTFLKEKKRKKWWRLTVKWLCFASTLLCLTTTARMLLLLPSMRVNSILSLSLSI